MAEIYTQQEQWLEALIALLHSAQLNSQAVWQRLVRKKIIQVLALGNFDHDLLALIQRKKPVEAWLSVLSESVHALPKKSDLPVFPVLMLPVFLD